MQITLDLPEDLALRLESLGEQLPTILELGLRELNASAQPGFVGVAEVLELLSALPDPEQVLALRPSETLQAEIQQLLEKNRLEKLTPAEEQRWEQYQYLEHLVRMAKARAALKLQQSNQA